MTEWIPIEIVGGAIERRTRMRVIDISSVGCLIESTVLLDVGTVGLLDVEIGGRRCTEAFRICRSMHTPGAVWPYRAGAEFLTLEVRTGVPLRHEIARFELAQERSAAASGTSSGSDLTFDKTSRRRRRGLSLVGVENRPESNDSR
jgi:hypothetical protein